MEDQETKDIKRLVESFNNKTFTRPQKIKSRKIAIKQFKILVDKYKRLNESSSD